MSETIRTARLWAVLMLGCFAILGLVCGAQLGLTWGDSPDASASDEEDMEYSHQINGIYAETEAKEHVSGSGFWLLVAGTGSATKETEDIKSYCFWEQKDNKGFQMEAYKADDDSFYFYRIDDDSSPRIEKWTIRHKNNFGFYKSRTEYRVYLNDEVMQDSWQF